jgi:hypothetical protein
MKLSKTAARIVCLAGMLGSLALAQAGAIQPFTGNFTQDDSEQIFNLVVNQPSTLTVLTLSYAGGIDGAGVLIPEGGFDPVFSLFKASNGLLIGESNNGGCGLVAKDKVTGECWDSYLTEPLAAGDYTLVLTENDNLPYGPYLSDGFSRTGQGDFTGPAFAGHAGAFYDETGDQRTSFWAVDIGGAVTRAGLSRVTAGDRLRALPLDARPVVISGTGTAGLWACAVQNNDTVTHTYYGA